MRFDLSPTVDRAMRSAAEAATLLGRPAADGWLIFVALIEDAELPPGERFRAAGGEFSRWRARAEAGPPGATPEQVLRLASAWTRHYSEDGTITSEVLTAVLFELDPGMAAFAESEGLDASRLRPMDHLDAGGEPIREAVPVLDMRTPSSQIEAARIIDASANRVREGFRVLDDYARFARNDRLLTETAKVLRHEFNLIMAEVPAAILLQARDTLGDVGTQLSAPGEYDRPSPREVARVNLKRMQEALRSIEEFGKLVSPTLPRRVEQLRYQTYTLEKQLVPSDRLRERLAEARLYMLLTRGQCRSALDWTIQEAAAGGVGVFQLREKGLADRELLALAREVRAWTRKAGALFVMNDRPDLAHLAEADGVHLGQDDLEVRHARQVAGPEMLVGVSCHTLEQLERAVERGVDYCGVGPTFPSRTKVFSEFAGIEFVAEAFKLTTVPLFAIGGIDAGTVARAVRAGANRVAVGAFLAEAENPRESAARLMGVLAEGR